MSYLSLSIISLLLTWLLYFIEHIYTKDITIIGHKYIPKFNKDFAILFSILSFIPNANIFLIILLLSVIGYDVFYILKDKKVIK